MKHSEYKRHLALIQRYDRLNTFEMELELDGRGWYRFVDHKKKIATTGYHNRDRLIANASSFRTDGQFMKVWKEKYRLAFPQGAPA
jgi:hypothetical protein